MHLVPRRDLYWTFALFDKGNAQLSSGSSARSDLRIWKSSLETSIDYLIEIVEQDSALAIRVQPLKFQIMKRNTKYS